MQIVNEQSEKNARGKERANARLKMGTDFADGNDMLSMSNTVRLSPVVYLPRHELLSFVQTYNRSFKISSRPMSYREGQHLLALLCRLVVGNNERLLWSNHRLDMKCLVGFWGIF